MIWREKRILLSTLGSLLVLNLLFFLTYRVRYQERVKDLDARLASVEKRRDDVGRGTAELGQRLEGYRQTQAAIDSIYSETWSTQQRRITRLMSEINQLAAMSRLVPRTISYGQTAQKKELGTSSMKIAFGVQGSYQQIRRLINLLELSKEFVIIESIAINNVSPDSSLINLSLQLKTLFRDQPLAREDEEL